MLAHHVLGPLKSAVIVGGVSPWLNGVGLLDGRVGVPVGVSCPVNCTLVSNVVTKVRELCHINFSTMCPTHTCLFRSVPRVCGGDWPALSVWEVHQGAAM